MKKVIGILGLVSLMVSTGSIAAKIGSDYKRHVRAPNDLIYVMHATVHARYIGTIDADVLNFHNKPHLDDHGGGNMNV